MNETEVTQGQYQGIEHWQPSAHKTCGSHCPVDMVDWQAAARFSNKLSELKGKQACFACEQGVCRPIKSYVRCRGWRLPTEAEWALAAHAGSATHETDLDLIAWHKGNSTSVHIVGKKQPNAWGLYDMVGNVWELCADSWRTSAFGSQSVDPLVVDNSFLGRLQGRVLRGGSFFRIGPAARILARWKQPERGGQFWTGFRLVYGGQ